MDALSAFDRYAPFTNVKELKDYSLRPLRKSMRVNLLKGTVEEYKKWAQKKGWTIAPVPWCPEGFFVDRIIRDEALGKDVLHVLGHTYMQEAASMLPVELLNPQPGDSVLDMSAAPGSKTTQIASYLQGRGVIIANDVQEKRLWSLSSNLQRSSVMNAIVTRKVGQWFAGNMTERFDCVLCDAPCTAQGTVRKDSDALTYCSIENMQKMAKLQKELLRSATDAAKVGGRIVYSTCTLTPEENEQVVREVVESQAGQVEVIDPSRDELRIMNHEVWDGWKQAVNDSYIVQKALGFEKLYPCLRLWPQTYDTEGFFSVLLRKIASTRDIKRPEHIKSFHSAILPRSRQKAYRASLERWYGASFIREGEIIFQNKENLLITTEEATDFALPVTAYITGMPFGKAVKDDNVRISQEMVTLRGAEASGQAVHLSEDQLRQLLRGQNIASPDRSLKNGDVILYLDDMPVCRGLHKDELVLNRLPREIVAMYA